MRLKLSVARGPASHSTRMRMREGWVAFITRRVSLAAREKSIGSIGRGEFNNEISLR
jgi:hypothetical protein